MKPKLLWLEEEPETLQFEKDIIEKNYGWDIIFINNKEEAINKINEIKFNLIITDLILPENEFYAQTNYLQQNVGISFVKEIRNSNRKGLTNSKVPIIVISCIMSQDYKTKVIPFLETPEHYLTKPIDIKLLSATIEYFSKTIIIKDEKNS